MKSKKMGNQKHFVLAISLFFLLEIGAFAQLTDSISFLPTPSGSFKIGTKDIYLTDSSRFEQYSKKNTCRKIAIKIWYPVDKEIEMDKELYMASIPVDVLNFNVPLTQIPAYQSFEFLNAIII